MHELRAEKKARDAVGEDARDGTVVGCCSSHWTAQREPSRSLRNGRKVAAGRGEAKISASMMERETLMT